METYLIDCGQREYKLPVLLGWNFSYGDSLPCDAFEVCFVYDEAMYDMLCKAVRFRAVFEGETVFCGVVDEFEVSFSEAGKTVSLCGRGLAALLLDNEAEAAELYGAGLDFILENYVYPCGVTQVRRKATLPKQQLVIGSGASCWSVLEEFMWFGCSQVPRFSPDGTLILGAEAGRRFVLDEKLALAEQVLRVRRYGVISQVLVKNKAWGTSSVVENSEFIARGGNCRRVVNVPRYTRYDAMRSTGDYQIRQSKAGELMFSLTLPTQFAAFPGDVMDIKYSATGLYGAYVVGRVNVFAWPEKAGTEVILTRREG